MPTLDIQGLAKNFGGLRAVHNFDLSLEEGELAGLIGPNGAGKTTVFNVISGVYAPSGGDVRFEGKSILGLRPHQIAQLGIGRTFQNIRLFGSLTVFDNVRTACHAHVSYRIADALVRTNRFAETEDEQVWRARELLTIFDLDTRRNELAKNLPYGEQRRLEIARALAVRPKLLLLDEPLAGTDPLARKEIMDLIHSLHKDHGHNIIISSHVLFEIERMTKNVALVYKGRAVATGHISEIRALIDKHPHNIVIEGDGLNKLAKELLDQDYTVSVGFYEGKKSIWVQVTKPDEFFSDIPRIVNELGCNITKIHSLDDNLEAVFRYLVGW